MDGSSRLPSKMSNCIFVKMYQENGRVFSVLLSILNLIRVFVWVGGANEKKSKRTFTFQTMTSSQMEEEECSLDIEGYLSPNSLPHAQKHLDPIPEDESGYLLANHLPETLSEAVIKDEETKSVSSEKSGQTTNGFQASKNSTSSGKDI